MTDDRTTEEIIKEILLEATEDGKTLSEDELITRLDKIPDFWDKAESEEMIDFLRTDEIH